MRNDVSVVRCTLAVTFVLAAGFVALGVYLAGHGLHMAWAVIPGALAVIAATISAWSTHRLLELQRDARRPYPYPSIDVSSRHQIVQLRVTNCGGTAAFDVQLRWQRPLLNVDGKPVRFTEQAGAPEIPVLLPHESVAVPVGGSQEVFNREQKIDHEGTVEFKDASGTPRCHHFHLSAEAYRHGLLYDREDPKTHYELQQIPKKLDCIQKAIAKLARSTPSDGSRGSSRDPGRQSGSRTRPRKTGGDA